MKAGSSVTLTCIIKQGPHDLGTVFWYKGTDIIQPTQSHVNDAESAPRITIQVINFRISKMMMHARYLASRRTRLIFIPVNLVHSIRIT